jgi:2-polyprenyl-3-methyl-5-hydroxy-6-metoxy-1,4-benzoquinol methylase
VLRRIPKDVWDNVEEIALFDDASPDETYDLAVGLKATHELEKLHVLKHASNLGYGGNQKAGYRYFLERGFDVVVLLHGDGQYAPEILSNLYAPLVRGEADAVLGSRMMKEYGGALRGGMPLYKYAGNRILTWYENRALGMKLSEFHSGYRAYSLKALGRIELARMSDDFHFDTEVLIKLHHQGFRISEVPIPTYYGGEICYVNGMRYAWNVYQAVRRYKATARSLRKAPEFAEYYAHYPVKESRGSSHRIALELAGAGNSILDIGCGEGFLAEKMAARGNRVTGVDCLESPSRLESMEAYHKADLQRGEDEWPERLGDQRFDRVLLLDVLEHLADPRPLLRQAAGALAPGGQVIVSLPNVANISVRLLLLLGRFDYADRGILDRTHLRFFTRRTARQLMEECGLEIVEERMTVIPAELALRMSHTNPVIRLLNRVLAAATWLMPGLFGYQVMFRARRRTGG